jgi:hypothetical protein
MPIQFQGISYVYGPADKVHDRLNREVGNIPWYKPYCVIQRPGLTCHEGAVISGFSSIKQFPALQTVSNANWEMLDEYVQTVGVEKVIQAAVSKQELEPTPAMREKAPEKLQILWNAFSEVFGKINRLKEQDKQLVDEIPLRSSLRDYADNFLKLDVKKHLRIEMSPLAELYLGWERFVQFCKSTLGQLTKKVF